MEFMGHSCATFCRLKRPPDSGEEIAVLGDEAMVFAANEDAHCNQKTSPVAPDKQPLQAEQQQVQK